MANESWTGAPERRRTERRQAATADRVPAALLVQLAASHAGIGPFATRARATPMEAALRYREIAATASRHRG